jgi:hypothetical protein
MHVIINLWHIVLILTFFRLFTNKVADADHLDFLEHAPYVLKVDAADIANANNRYFRCFHKKNPPSAAITRIIYNGDIVPLH